jgi:hypothetical protein
MLKGLKDLSADPDTKVIVLISKPPAQAIADEILAQARAAGKPVVVIFLGADPETLTAGNVFGARTLEDAARAAVALAQGRRPPAPDEAAALPSGLPALASGQKYVRGLFSGGTFCFQATMLLQENMPVHSNTKVGNSLPLADMWKSEGHTVVDLGDDVFTRGRPHPMIDYRLRTERIVHEAQDGEMAVLLLDVVLGYGSNADPAAELAPALNAARKRAEHAGRPFLCVGHICGTSGDPQGLERQAASLRAAGMLLTDSNAQAVRLARRIAQQTAR